MVAVLSARTIRQIGEQLVLLDRVPSEWTRIDGDVVALVLSARQAARSDELALIAKSLERRREEVEQWLKETASTTSDPVEINPAGLVNEPHNTTTNSINDITYTVTATGESRRVETAPPFPSPPQPDTTQQGELQINAQHLLDLAPRLTSHVLSNKPDWRDIVDAAGQGLRTELGISLSLWGEACRVMGRISATVAVAIVSTKPPEHFTRGAGGYFAGMLRRAERGELHLERSLWALKDRK